MAWNCSGYFCEWYSAPWCIPRTAIIILKFTRSVSWRQCCSCCDLNKNCIYSLNFLMETLLVRVGWRSSNKSLSLSNGAGNVFSFSSCLSLQVCGGSSAVSLCGSRAVCINGLAGDFTGNGVGLSLRTDHSAVESRVCKPQRFVDFQAGFHMTNQDPTGFDWHFGNGFSAAEISL